MYTAALRYHREGAEHRQVSGQHDGEGGRAAGGARRNRLGQAARLLKAVGEISATFSGSKAHVLMLNSPAGMSLSGLSLHSKNLSRDDLRGIRRRNSGSS